MPAIFSAIDREGAMRRGETPSPLIAAAFAVALLLVIHASPAESSPGRTVVIHNNTRATLTLSLLHNPAEFKIPPESKKSFFNILRRGRNTLEFTAQCVKGYPSRQLVVWVSGEATKVREYVFFAKHFGKSAMFDRPGCGRLASKWRMFRIGDCVGGDVATTRGISPDTSVIRSHPQVKCAVCWDGHQFRNKYRSGAFCVYKTTQCDRCSRGPNPGIMYSR
jgi:hypothetical protein